MSDAKEQKMYLVEYTDNQGENLTSVLVLASSNTLAWEKVSEYVGLPMLCTHCQPISSGIWVL